MSTIGQVGTTMSRDENAEGYYKVHVWIKLETGGIGVTEYYTRLTWTEAVDLWLLLFDENRPGTQHGEHGTIEALW